MVEVRKSWEVSFAKVAKEKDSVKGSRWEWELMVVLGEPV
jgi:hypothetical protein